ncbi:hypothetical protein LY90DRAFT_620630 [Neocallimastix californiae]|uniref:Autophagy-related protein 2 n=1 Tax=Neocallimastix californiae TaxID=1754190 RepID=A0A1Y2FE37_9FUNG|nr:hypothetical protein LY90DRAFT_620630 [Neocallimastix californiae]|eukprot:ORY81105.1 hypothetical protein LY90DRAFT_620630 [Neocallimastix californiae]
MADEIQFQLNKFGTSLLSNKSEEIQIEPILFITSSKDNYFFSMTTNQSITKNNDLEALLNEFLNSNSSDDYGKFWFKEKALQQSKYQIDVNIKDLFVNIDTNIVKGIMHMINYVFDEFINNDNSMKEKANSSAIQECKEKKLELTSLNLKINNIKILLFGLEDICYQLTLEKFDAFISFSNLGPYFIYIRNELFSFNESNLNSSLLFPLIQNNPFQNIKDMIEVSIYSLGNEASNNLNVLNLSIILSNMLFNIDIPRLFKLLTLSEVFNDLPAIHSTSVEPLALRFSLAFNNILLGYEKLEKFSPQFIIRFDNINIYSVETFILGDVLSLNLNISISKVNALLTNQRSIPLETQDVTSNISLLDYLKHLGYSNMLSINILFLNININDSKLMINISKEKSIIYFDMCSDSLVTLYQIINNALLLIPQSETKPSDIELPIFQKVNNIINEDAYIQEVNMIINEDFFKKIENGENDDILIINDDYLRNIPNYENPKSKKVYRTKDKVISYSNDFKLNDNFLEDICNKMKLKTKKIKSEFLNPVVNIKVENINFYIRIFNGYDWKTTATSKVQNLDENGDDKTSTEYMSRSKESIDIEIKGISINYYVNPENSYYTNKLGLKINEFGIINKIYGYHQFLTYQNPIIFPMLKFEMLNIKPISYDPTLESIVTFYVSPLRFYVDQDTLFKFYDIMNCFNSDTDRKVNISDIRIIVNYEAKNLNINNLRNGQYKEVMNVTSLIDASLNFESLKFEGVSGVDGIVRRVMEKYLPMAIEQVPSIVLYTKSIYPFFRISQSVVDSIKNIYKSYKDDKSIMPAIKGGAAHVMSTTTSESFKIISIFSSKAQDDEEESSSMNDECNKKQEGPKKVNILLHYKYNNIFPIFMANVTNTMSKVSFKISTVFDTKDKMENKQFCF